MRRQKSDDMLSDTRKAVYGSVLAANPREFGCDDKTAAVVKGENRNYSHPCDIKTRISARDYAICLESHYESEKPNQ